MSQDNRKLYTAIGVMCLALVLSSYAVVRGSRGRPGEGEGSGGLGDGLGGGVDIGVRADPRRRRRLVRA
jgi:hypothetical protein